MRLISSYGVPVNVADELADHFLSKGFKRPVAAKAAPAQDPEKSKPRTPSTKKTDTDD